MNLRKGFRNRDILQGSEVVAKLCQVLGQNISLIACYAKRGGQTLNCCHVVHGFGWVDAKQGLHLVDERACFAGQPLHGHAKQVCSFIVAIELLRCVAKIGCDSFQRDQLCRRPHETIQLIGKAHIAFFLPFVGSGHAVSLCYNLAQLWR